MHIREGHQKLNRGCRILAENALESIWTYDIQAKKFTFISPAVFKLSGYTVQEAMQMSLADFLPKQSLEKANGIIKLLLDRYTLGERQDDRLTSCSDFNLLCKDQTIKQVEITAKIIYNDETGFLEMLGVLWDITQRKKQEEHLNQALEDKEEMIRRLHDSESALKGYVEELHQKNKTLRHKAIRDSLTGIYNRYYFDQKVMEEAERCRRYNDPLSIALFDIDSFKAINDTSGHQAGDQALVRVAETIGKCIRAYDTFARWGGDEFTLLMPRTTLSKAKIVVEKIRHNIEAMHCENITTPITASIGVVELMRGESEESWFKRVDYAMFCSKSKGRNCITAMDWESALPFVQIKLDWKKDWECGNADIDGQHQQLVALGNALLGVALTDLHSEATANALQALMDHIARHFKDEERILRETSYPEVEEHAKIHQALIRHTEALKARFDEGNLTSSAILSFVLDNVVMEHLMQEDTRFFPYLKGFCSTDTQAT